jgi:hypothetical protein
MGLWSNIVNWFNPLMAKFKKFISQLFSGALAQMLAALQDIAQNAIEQVAADPSIITDEDKRKAAFKIIAEYAQSRGLEAKDSIINLAIELAVAAFKKE